MFSFIFPGILLTSKIQDLIVDTISSQEFLNFNGQKFSKSRGVGIFGMDLIDKNFGKSCYWRFYLIRRRPEVKDSDFSIKEFIDLINSDLRGNLGNLCQRVIKFINLRCNCIVSVVNIDNEDSQFVLYIDNLFKESLVLMESIRLRDGISKAFQICSRTNQFIQRLQEKRDDRIDYQGSLASHILLLFC